jgi:hypothetical protein
MISSEYYRRIIERIEACEIDRTIELVCITLLLADIEAD